MGSPGSYCRRPPWELLASHSKECGVPSVLVAVFAGVEGETTQYLCARQGEPAGLRGSK